ncbi:MAG: 50S ribosomal protein L10 [Acidobacteriota bacterium]
MNRSDKVAAVAELNERWKPVKNAILVGFSGLAVEQANDLRRQIRTAESSYLVVQNRLAIRAAAGTPLEALIAGFAGPTAVAFNDNEPVGMAKVLADFSKENPALTLKAGVIDSHVVIDAEGLTALAKLPGLPELRAQMLRAIQGPATQLARLLATPATQLARVLQARQDKLAENDEK